MKHRILSVALLVIFGLLVNYTEAHAVIQNLNSQTGQTQTFQNDSNMTISSSNDIHSLIWQGFLPISRGGTGASSFMSGSIPFIFNGIFSEDNLNFFWDNTNKRLGIGTAFPSSSLEVSGTAKVTSLTSTNDSIINSLNIGKGGGGGGDESNNTAIGQNALLSNTTGWRNLAVGPNALQSNTTGYQNVAIGGSALKATNTNRNTAVGSGALGSGMNSGENNTAVGALTLSESNTTGSYNTAVGTQTLQLNTSGIRNTAIGMHALGSNTTGSDNVAVGFGSLGNLTGGGNVAIGTRSFMSNQSGSSNIIIGSNAAILQADGTALTSPINNIYIGNNVRAFNNSDSNSIVIGNDLTVGAGANTAVIGNASMGNVYFGSVAGNANIHGRKLYLGSSSIPGCIIMGDSDGIGVTYLTVNDGVLSASTTLPAACQ